MPYPFDGNALLSKLTDVCPHPIVTGVEEQGECAVYYVEGATAARYATGTEKGFFCGSGDVFASAFVGALAVGKEYPEAVKIATDFTTACIRRSAKEVPDHRYGLNFEKEIPYLLKLLGKI
jgi:pyridoxine kinase